MVRYVRIEREYTIRPEKNSESTLLIDTKIGIAWIRKTQSPWRSEELEGQGGAPAVVKDIFHGCRL
jgi:hypothetical protein